MKIFDYSDVSNADIIQKATLDFTSVESVVKDILEDVKENGDEALFRYAKQFDGELSSLRVTDAEIAAAMKRVDPYFLDTLRMAKENIEFYHKAQCKEGYELRRGTVILGQKYTPLKRVGVYVPGGTASYPSTVLMNVIPARLAGVPEIYITTPADKNGNVGDNILAAAHLAGASAIFKIGGAQAVAALAYGTETVPKTDKIVGPGNIYVAVAKRLVFGIVDIDMIAGPSEILVLADKHTDPDVVAADLLSQAEHDKNASAILICDDRKLASRVSLAVESRLCNLPRREIAAESIRNNGKIIVVDNLQTGMDVANAIAPEHLLLLCDNPFDYLPLVKNAGSVFLGRYTPESLGDYFAGTNHTLPTNGTARFSSPLSVDDFVKKFSYLYYDESDLQKEGARIADFAMREGLTAHADAVTVRINKLNEGKLQAEDGQNA